MMPVVVIAAMVNSGCSADRAADASGDLALPEDIHGLPLVESHSGPAADSMIAELHKSELAAAESAIGIYGPSDMRAILYVSRFTTEAQAAEQIDAMSDRISAGTPGFGHQRQFEIREQQVHSVFGRGQVHYYYVTGREMIWLTVPPNLARPALGELLDVPLSEIPPLTEAPTSRPAA
jgi:hypothetical protein